MTVRSLAPAAVAAAVVLLAAGQASGGQAQFRPVVVTRGLDQPVQVTAPLNEPRNLYVVEQGGSIRVVRSGTLRPGRFLDLRSRVSTGSEQGLLGLAFDPSYARNRFVYVNFTDRNGDTNVVRYRTNGARVLAGSARRLLFVRQPYSNHNGGGLAFGPDGYLYVGLGDGGSAGDPEDRAQSMSTFLGKLLRIDVRRPGRRPAIVALGLRNPWRYSFDRATGDLYIGDVGQGEIEEIDFTPRRSPGLENYGWDLYEGSRRFENTRQGPGVLVIPVFEYSHDSGCSVTGGHVYRGRAKPALVGRYVLGDYCSGRLWSFRVSAGAAQDVQSEPFSIESLTSFGENARGELFATSHSGVLYRLT